MNEMDQPPIATPIDPDELDYKARAVRIQEAQCHQAENAAMAMATHTKQTAAITALISIVACYLLIGLTFLMGAGVVWVFTHATR